MTITEAIKKVVDRVDLAAADAESVLEQIMTGQCTDAQIASLLTALRMKGETVAELTGFARVMRRKSASVRPHTTVSAEIGDTEREALIAWLNEIQDMDRPGYESSSVPREGDTSVADEPIDDVFNLQYDALSKFDWCID